MTDKPVPTIDALNAAYFEGTAQGELRIRRCEACRARFRFAHARCPQCWSDRLGWERAGGAGRVSHFSIVHQPPSSAFAGDVPYVLALVELDEGVRMMTSIVTRDPAAVHVGMRVTVAFERRGAIALPVFRPV